MKTKNGGIDYNSESKYNALDLVEISEYNFYSVLFFFFLMTAIFSLQCDLGTYPPLPYSGQLFKLSKFFFCMRCSGKGLHFLNQ